MSARDVVFILGTLALQVCAVLAVAKVALWLLRVWERRAMDRIYAELDRLEAEDRDG